MRCDEILNLSDGDISHDDGRVWYRYRGKGGKSGKRELRQPTCVADVAALRAFGWDFGGHAAGCVPVVGTSGRHARDHL